MTRMFIRCFSFVAALAFAGNAYAIKVEEVKSPGGITAYLAQDRTNPIIAISFMFQGGSALDRTDKLGLSIMASGLLDEGAGDKDSFAFQSELEDRAISLRFSADRDAVRGGVTTTTQASGVAFDLLNQAMTKPRFDAEPVERVRRQMLVSLKAQQENPSRIASRTLGAALFGDHPYGRVDDGTPETVAALTVDDLRTWQKTRLTKDRLIVAAAGDITPKQLGAALDKIFAGLPAKSDVPFAVPEAKVSDTAREIKIDKPLPQTMILMAQPSIKRADPDWYTAQVLDYTFGSGSFASRLMDEVREKRGLAYSVGTSMQALASAGYMVGSAGTRSEQARQTLDIMRAEWAKIQKDGITEDELNDAKQYLTGAWPLRFSSTGSVAETLVAVQKDNLGLNYLDQRNDYINAVTLADAKRVAAKLYKPEALTVVLVGPELKPAPAVTAPSAPAKKRPERESKAHAN
ncbi:MAG: insulinase family protein [Rhodospirillaceae bacterium]|nr:insulinase family protein [Rhodospirillaceae bacterium]